MGRVKDYFHDEIIRQQAADYDDHGDRWVDEANRRTDMHNDDILIAALTAAALDAKRRLALADISRIRIDIEIEGGTEDMNLTCTFRVGRSYDPSNATGNRLSEVIDEFLRRKGWTDKHAPLLLSAPDAVPPPQDKPVPGIDTDPVF